MPTDDNPLRGTWRKVDAPPCADRYPADLTFATGTYRGVRGEGQRFVWWDAGTYRIEDDSADGRARKRPDVRLHLTVASDELVEYAITLDADVLTVVDPDGCRFTYHRVEPPG